MRLNLVLSKQGISLSPTQDKAANEIETYKYYSSYPTQEGLMVYAKLKNGDMFIHLYNNGHTRFEDGWDGGNLAIHRKERR